MSLFVVFGRILNLTLVVGMRAAGTVRVLSTKGLKNDEVATTEKQSGVWDPERRHGVGSKIQVLHSSRTALSSVRLILSKKTNREVFR
jgi:hypothetical protein